MLLPQVATLPICSKSTTWTCCGAHSLDRINCKRSRCCDQLTAFDFCGLVLQQICCINVWFALDLFLPLTLNAIFGRRLNRSATGQTAAYMSALGAYILVCYALLNALQRSTPVGRSVQCFHYTAHMYMMLLSLLRALRSIRQTINSLRDKNVYLKKVFSVSLAKFCSRLNSTLY